MKKNEKFEGFTIGLALVDCLPVLFCCITLGILAARMDSRLFYAGNVLIIGAGALKCLWKFIVALTGKNIRFLFYQMRVVMPLGFLLLLAALVLNSSKLDGGAIISQMTGFPNLLFYLLGIIGMGCMSWFAKKLDPADAKSNWIEQLTNAGAQLCFLLGVLL